MTIGRDHRWTERLLENDLIKALASGILEATGGLPYNVRVLGSQENDRMLAPPPSVKLPTLEQVIDPAPLIVGPSHSVLAVMMQMNQIQDSSCTLEPHLPAAEIALTASCALVMEHKQLLGLLTERDIVKLAAAGRDLATVPIGDVMTRSVISLPLDKPQTVLTALNLLQQHQIRHLPVLDRQGYLVGLITPYSIRRVLQPANLLKLRRVAEVMTTAIIAAAPTDSVLSIAQLMTEHRVSCVVIRDAAPQTGGKIYPLGMLTERDIVQFQILQLDVAQISAQAVMSTPLFCTYPQDSLWDAHQAMQHRRVRRLGVVNDQGELVGLLTQTHLLEVFDPIELSGVVDTLQQQVEERTTQLEAINQQLRQAQEELENRVQERTEKVLQANAQLQQEIQERRQAENTLRETLRSLEFQKFALDQSAIVAITDHQGTITEINDQFCQISQYRRAELVGQNHRIINSGFHPPEFFRSLWATIASGTVWQGEIKNQAKDGSFYWVATTIVPGLDSNGKPSQYLSIRFDITQRKQAEETIREQAALLDITTDAIIFRDFENRILFWNHGAEQLYGWSAAEALGQVTTTLLYKHSPQLQDALQIVVEQGEWQGELEKINKSGKAVTVQSRWTLVRDEANHPKAILSVDTDITEKKLLEDQFLHAQRLESLGTLASGIAHDLNNILTPILAVAQLLPLKLPHLDAQNQRLLQMLQASSRRGSDLVSQILAFARGAAGKRATIQAGHLLHEVGRVAKQTFPKSIDICEDVTPPALWLVSADATQLHQIFMNLCINARDAMPEGGTLTLEAKNVTLDANYVRMHLDAQEGPYLAVTIADTGTGITPEVRDRMFEPFFTTKELGKGTGLGLSTVFTIVKQHGGFVTVYSELNQGTNFTVYLPALADSAIVQPTESLDDFDGNGELILVVDDEAAIREIMKVSLEAHNYRVITACDGIDAFSVYAEHKAEVCLIILDLMMPTIDTTTIIMTLKRMNPQVQIIAMSGLAPNPAVIAADSTTIQAFLAKPFTANELLQTLHQVIHRRASA